MTPTPTESIDQIPLGYLDKNILQQAKKEVSKGRPLNDLTEVDQDGYIPSLEATFVPPPFTIKELRDSIPAHLFQKSLLKSSIYLIVNLIIVAALFYAATFIHTAAPPVLAMVLWPLYWWFQGVAATGVWVIAHECGHQSFSDSKTINNIVGLVLHSILLVPYHPWRISHAQHHAATGHIAQDQVFVPKRRSDVKPDEQSPWEEALEVSPIYTVYNIFRYLVLGWPAYLLTHRSGQKYPQYTSHFHPTSPIFEKRHRGQVLLSDAAILIVLSLIATSVYLTSFWTMAKFFGLPYLLVNCWLVTITLLQHTDVYLPHYAPHAWNFVRGALTTVDRDYGWFLNHALHHIQDSHVAHHLFSQMPFYNAIKATPYLKAKLGEYYLYDRTPVWKALYRAVRNCVFVEDTGDILFYRRK